MVRSNRALALALSLCAGIGLSARARAELVILTGATTLITFWIGGRVRHQNLQVCRTGPDVRPQ